MERTTLAGAGPLAALVLVSAIWGAMYVQVKDAVGLYPAFSFLTLRFAIAAVALAALGAFLRGRSRIAGRDVAAGVLLGGVLAAGFALHVLGLAATSATTAGFVTALLVPLTPIWAAVVLREHPGLAVLLGVAAATVGVGLVSGGPVGADGPTILLMGGAAAFSLHVVLTRRFALDSDAVALTTLQTFVAALVLGSVALVHEPVRVPSGNLVWLALVVSGLGGTALAFGLQTWAQRRVSASQTAVVLTLEPVFAAAFGYALAGDRLGATGVIGCSSILVAMLASICRQPTKRSSARCQRLVSVTSHRYPCSCSPRR
jgi:drug/metabolite transporter (DMT)-like permease